MPRGRNKRANVSEASSQVAIFASADQRVQIPKNFEDALNTPELEALWHEFSSQRLPDAWTPAELQILAEIVSVSHLMTRCLEAIAAEGSTVEDHNGKTVTNPALSAYTQMGNRRDSMCRALRIFTLANNSQAVKSATDASARRNAQTLIEGDSGDPFEEMLR